MNGRRDASPHRTRLTDASGRERYLATAGSGLRGLPLWVPGESGDVGGEARPAVLVGAVVVAADLSGGVDEEEVGPVEDGDLGRLGGVALDGELGAGRHGV